MGKTVTKIIRRDNGILYPINYNGKLYYKGDCDDLFVRFYTNKKGLRTNGSINVSKGVWLYPDGSIYDEELDENYCNYEDETRGGY
jgi:hypothetical protein